MIWSADILMPFNKKYVWNSFIADWRLNEMTVVTWDISFNYSPTKAVSGFPSDVND